MERVEATCWIPRIPDLDVPTGFQVPRPCRTAISKLPGFRYVQKPILDPNYNQQGILASSTI